MLVLLDDDAVGQRLSVMAARIVERAGADHLALVGIRRGGVPLAGRLAETISRVTGRDVPLGAVDISLYRDDAPTALPSPRIGRSDIPFAVEGRRVVLVDDVLYTGRTVRAALDAVLDYGRPKLIELAVLVDRGGRELPIEARYVGEVAHLEENEQVEVVSDAQGFRAFVTARSSSLGADHERPKGKEGT